MAFDRESAKAAGYTDEEIDAFLQSHPAAEQATQKNEAVGEPPDSNTVVNATGTSPSAIATTGALAVAPYVGTAEIGRAHV